MGKHFDDYLAHYSSQYYDPEKARAYYLRTRELKDRKAGKGLTKEERASQAKTNEAVGYVKKQIGEKRQGEVTQLRTDNAARIEKLRGNVEAARLRITQKFEALAEKIMRETQIPDNASPKLREFLLKQRVMRSGSAKKAASKELKQVATDMRSAVGKAREEYAAARQATADKYDKALETEESNIRKNIK